MIPSFHATPSNDTSVLSTERPPKICSPSKTSCRSWHRSDSAECSKAVYPRGLPSRGQGQQQSSWGRLDPRCMVSHPLTEHWPMLELVITGKESFSIQRRSCACLVSTREAKNEHWHVFKRISCWPGKARLSAARQKTLIPPTRGPQDYR